MKSLSVISRKNIVILALYMGKTVLGFMFHVLFLDKPKHFGLEKPIYIFGWVVPIMDNLYHPGSNRGYEEKRVRVRKQTWGELSKTT